MFEIDNTKKPLNSTPNPDSRSRRPVFPEAIFKTYQIAGFFSTKGLDPENLWSFFFLSSGFRYFSKRKRQYLSAPSFIHPLNMKIILK